MKHISECTWSDLTYRGGLSIQWINFFRGMKITDAEGVRIAVIGDEA